MEAASGRPGSFMQTHLPPLLMGHSASERMKGCVNLPIKCSATVKANVRQRKERQERPHWLDTDDSI